jgi:hypothetical protein
MNETIGDIRLGINGSAYSKSLCFSIQKLGASKQILLLSLHSTFGKYNNGTEAWEIK